MKKRSVLSAVAMLLVSALVLTSATYAWFAASDAADVDEISANVTNNAGALLLRAYEYDREGTDSQWADVWTTSLNSGDFGELTTTLNPISLNVYDAAGTTSIETYRVQYDGAAFTAGSAPTRNGVNGDYLWYQFRVQYAATSATATDIEMTVGFAQDEDFEYGLLNVTSSDSEAVTGAYLYGQGTSGHTTPLDANVTGPVTDANATPNAIIDSADTPALNYTLAAAAMSDGAGSTQNALVNDDEAATIVLFDNVDNTSGTGGVVTATINVYVWAEGNNANCYGAVTSASAGFEFDFAVV